MILNGDGKDSLLLTVPIIHWIKRFVRFYHGAHPEQLSARDLQSFLTYLAVEGKVSASTQNQALLFLFRHVLERDVDNLSHLIRAEMTKRLPIVLSKEEVRRVIDKLSGDSKLIASLLYGMGLSLMECLTLRVQDIDMERNEIIVRNGKGGKDRITKLPSSLRAELRGHLEEVRKIHQKTWRKSGGRYSYRTRSERNFRILLRTGGGNELSPNATGGKTPVPARKAATTSMHPSQSVRSEARYSNAG